MKLDMVERTLFHRRAVPRLKQLIEWKQQGTGHIQRVLLLFSPSNSEYLEPPDETHPFRPCWSRILISLDFDRNLFYLLKKGWCESYLPPATLGSTFLHCNMPHQEEFNLIFGMHHRQTKPEILDHYSNITTWYFLFNWKCQKLQ